MTISKRLFMMAFVCAMVLSMIPYTAFSQTNDSPYLKNSRQLIYQGKRSGEGYFSHDGRYLIFQAEREDDNPFYQIYVLDFTSGDIYRVSPGYGKTTCAYFNWNNSNEIIFSSTHLDPNARQKQQDELDFRASGKTRRYSWDYDENFDIFSCTLNCKNPIQLTKTKGYDAESSFSPNGKYIAFTSNRSAFERKLTEEEKKIMDYDPSFFNEIYIMQADGSNVKRLTYHDGYDGGPFFSPDGKKIVWRRFNVKGDKAEIYTMDIDGSNIKQITNFKHMSWAPYYYPNQDHIIFTSNKLGFSNFELFVVDTEGLKNPVRVSYRDGFDGLPVFAPDGKKIVWTSTTSSGQSQLFIADYDYNAILDAIENAPYRDKTSYSSAITVSDIRDKISFLASDELAGRMTGTEGARLAANYAVERFKNIGLTTWKDDDFLHPFSFSSDTKIVNENTNMSIDNLKLTLNTDYYPLLSSSNGEIHEKLFFVGYGIKVVGNDDINYNSYDNVDIKDKIVLIIEDVPTDIRNKIGGDADRYIDLKYRILIAREMGAIGVIVIGNQFKQRHDRFFSDVGMVSVKINDRVANRILSKHNTSLEQVKKDLLAMNPHVQTSFELMEMANIKVSMMREKETGYNVIGLLSSTTQSDDYIVIGAHYDHLGMGEYGSLLINNRFDEIHNGADDNASGSAVVMELAEYFAERKQSQHGLNTNIVFALWSGEEMGLIGSSYFVNQLPVDVKKVKAYLNYDMVGRMKNNELIVQGLGSADEWKTILEKKNIIHGFTLRMQNDPYLPTDATSFYKIGIPIISFFTGLHDDYHKPSDDVDKINFNDLARITSFSADLILELMNTDLKYQKVTDNTIQTNMQGFSVYLGTIPDYASEVDGVKLSGVRQGGPADKAGLQKDDIIVKLKNKTINNIYDYTFILGELVAGEEVEIIIIRDNKRKVLKIIPGSKK